MKQSHLTAGVDPGAGAVKVVIARSRAGSDGEVLASTMQRLRRRNVIDVINGAFDDACKDAGVTRADFDYIASTGDGDSVSFRTGHFYSMTTHARGALFLRPDARAALDVGALHARALRMNEQGRVLAHRMTSQCASGSGQFVENIARYLGVPLDDVGKLSKEAQSPEKVSSICAVLAETDVINMVSRGIDTTDILKGIHLSIAGRLVQLLRAVSAEGVVVLTGGLSRDEGLVAAVLELLEAEKQKKNRRRALGEVDVVTHPDGPLAGAIGAALLGAYRYRQLEDRGQSPTAMAAAPA